MSATGFYSIYKGLGFKDSDLYCAFSFNNNALNESWVVNSGKTGIITNPAASGDLFSVYGSGKFNGSTALRLAGSFDLDEWTALFVCEKSGGTANVPIFGSSIDTVYSGFSVGLNAANRPYVSFYNDTEGFITKELNIPPIANKNILGAYKNINEFGLYYIDPNTKAVYSDSVDIPFSQFTPTKKVFLGSGFWNQGFNGTSLFLDEFYLIDKHLSSEKFQKLSSGFYSALTPDIIHHTTLCSPYSYVTGFPVPLFSGITGYVETIAGETTDTCGNTETIFTREGVSGVISGTEYVTVIGQRCKTYTRRTPGFYDINTGFLLTLGMSSITQLYDLDPNDELQSYTTSGLAQQANYNIYPVYNKANKKFHYNITLPSGSKAPQVYANGLYQISGSKSSVRHGYYYDDVLAADYYQEQKNISFNGFYNQSDIVLTDIEGRGVSYSIDDLSLYPMPGDFGGLIFVNGVLLLSGVDYNNTEFLLDLPGPNYISTIPISDFQQYYSGNSPVFNFTGKFLRNTSKVWLNGIRYNNLLDYLEISDFDYLSGKYINVSGDSLYDPIGSDKAYDNFFE